MQVTRGGGAIHRRAEPHLGSNPAQVCGWGGVHERLCSWGAQAVCRAPGGAEVLPDQSCPFGGAAAVLLCCLPFPTAARNQLHRSHTHTEGLGHTRACRNISRNKAEIFLNTVSSSAAARPFFSCYGHTAILGLALPPSPALLSPPCPSASGWAWPTAQRQPGTSAAGAADVTGGAAASGLVRSAQSWGRALLSSAGLPRPFLQRRGSHTPHHPKLSVQELLTWGGRWTCACGAAGRARLPRLLVEETLGFAFGPRAEEL